MPDDGDPGDWPRLEGRFVEAIDTGPVEAVEAYIGEDEFYVSFRDQGDIVYSGGSWPERVDLEGLAGDMPFGGPHILPLAYQRADRWQTLPDDLLRPALLSSEQWGRFRARLFANVLPRDKGSGVAMHFDADDYFLYYNEFDRFEARLLTDKPANYRVSASLDFGEFVARGLPVLERFLEAEGISQRRVVFSTGDAGAYSLPFLYVNIDLPIAIFARFPSSPKDRIRTPEAIQLAQSIGHVAHSHLGSLLVRPVSSVFRLFVVASEAAAETVRPAYLSALETRPIPEIEEDRAPMNIDEWEARLDELTGRKSSSGRIRFLIDGEEFFTRLIDVLTSATRSIYIRTYIFDNDDIAETIGTLLRRRSADGLDVRVLLDGLGTIVATGTDPEDLPPGYVPPESVRVFLESGTDINVRQVGNPWLVAGDHVKTTIVDERIAFTGGMNIGREYRYTWHDMMMEVEGPIVDLLLDQFYDAWAHAGVLGDFGYFLHKLKPGGNGSNENGQSIRLLRTEPGNAEIFRVQREAIRSAQKLIYVENAYFADDAMLYELAKARRRGVDVRVIMPLISNHGVLNSSNALAANAMLEHGIRVFLYPGMSHVKAAIFDGWASLGSANWDNLSFHTNRELNLATSDPVAIEALTNRLFGPDFASSVELTEPFPERWSDHLLEIVADYLL